ncbi:hypothetical protein ANN_15868 [Periplaneta americana]|uniref:Dynein axonemal assembly factor 1 homolog n=1 Tax=Periplaneta americana TaxID=6978 RepID=A0ABQ8SHE1_PERAM|nr:hypothetical protein ANN_15868 [Periplaneta americana]
MDSPDPKGYASEQGQRYFFSKRAQYQLDICKIKSVKYALKYVCVFIESSADDASKGETNPGLQSSVSVDTCPSMEEADDREEDDKPKEILIVDPDTDELDMNHQRIGKLENLEPLTKVERLYFRWNFIKKIENLETLVTLRELELYDNQITCIENLDSLVNLEILDLSFNRIREIKGLENLHNLEKLFLCANKISRIENVNHLKKLTLLELGDNKIRASFSIPDLLSCISYERHLRKPTSKYQSIEFVTRLFHLQVIENLEGLDNLKCLYLGKNKITKIQNLETLKTLDVLSLQCNRLTKIENLETLTELDQLYLSENGLTRIEGLDKNLKMTTLDLANNKIRVIENVDHLAMLEEFWMNDNLVDDWTSIETLNSNKKLVTIYLEHNPVFKDPNYRRKIKISLPWVSQIDATLCR